MERITRGLLLLSALVAGLAVLAILGFLVWFSLPLLRGEGLTQVLSWRWRPFQGEFGILPMLVGSLCLSATSMAVALPMGLGLCCFAHGVGPRKPAALVMGVVRFMTSVPTVVYGFVAVFLLVPLVRAAFASGSGFSWLAASLTLSLLVLPTVVLVLHAQFELIEPRVRLTTAALGLTRTQAVRYVVLPAARRGLLAASALGFGRAVGDTLVPLMLAGNAPQVPGSLLDAMRTLTAHIALVVATDSQSTAYLSLFACGLILFVTSVAVNLTLRRLNRADGGRA
ncbi:PstC family ABC transporter permease [Desulfocurvibacter africanus]|nr:ABC transporter permease subunit [Desulfocurvibacter africanus]